MVAMPINSKEENMKNTTKRLLITVGAEHDWEDLGPECAEAGSVVQRCECRVCLLRRFSNDAMGTTTFEDGETGKRISLKTAAERGCVV
jgi:hypothetical protein